MPIETTSIGSEALHARKLYCSPADGGQNTTDPTLQFFWMGQWENIADEITPV